MYKNFLEKEKRYEIDKEMRIIIDMLLLDYIFVLTISEQYNAGRCIS